MSVPRTLISAFLLLALVPPAALAQSQGAAIAGTVKDTSGARVPGVIVEASSPALIERARTVVTDGQGAFSIAGGTAQTYSCTVNSMHKYGRTLRRF